MTEDLKPCPLCGLKAVYHERTDKLGHSVSCSSRIYCGISISGTPMHPAIPRWNKRVDPRPTNLTGQTKNMQKYTLQFRKNGRWAKAAYWTIQGKPVSLRAIKKALVRAANWFPDTEYRIKEVV